MDERVGSVKEIDFRKLLSEGKRVFLFDFDNTLGRWSASELAPWAIETLNSIRSMGGTVVIVSNGRPRKLPIDVPVVWRALKPLPFVVLWKLRDVLRNRNEIVVIGDQYFTDMLFGTLIGAYTIKVEPLDRGHECVSTKVLRLLERLFFRV